MNVSISSSIVYTWSLSPHTALTFPSLEVSIGFQKNEYTFPEKDIDKTYTVHLQIDRQDTFDGVLSVIVSLSGVMDATEGEDFVIVSEIVVFQPNEQYKNFTVLILSDTIPEGVEEFTLSVTPIPANVSVLGQSTINPETIIHIPDDDGVCMCVFQMFMSVCVVSFSLFFIIFLKGGSVRGRLEATSSNMRGKGNKK